MAGANRQGITAEGKAAPALSGDSRSNLHGGVQHGQGPTGCLEYLHSLKHKYLHVLDLQN